MRAITNPENNSNPFEKAKKKGKRRTQDIKSAGFSQRNARQMPARRLQRGR